MPEQDWRTYTARLDPKLKRELIADLRKTGAPPRRVAAFKARGILEQREEEPGETEEA